MLSAFKLEIQAQLTPLHFTTAPAARPDAVVSEQQVYVEVSIGNRRLVETQNIHVPTMHCEASHHVSALAMPIASQPCSWKACLP